MWPSGVGLAFHLSNTCTVIWCHLVIFSFGKRKKFLKMCVFLAFVNTKIAASLEESKFKIIMNVISYYLIHGFGSFSVYYLNFCHLKEPLGMVRKVDYLTFV